MPLDEPESIDAIRFDPASGACILTIRDDWDWDHRRVHVKALLLKLSFYLEFIDEAHLVVALPCAIGRQVIIEIDAAHPLPDFDGDFIGELKAVCALYQVQLRYRSLDHPRPFASPA